MVPFTIIENNLTYICVYVFICWCVFTVCAKVGSWQQPVNTCMCVFYTVFLIRLKASFFTSCLFLFVPFLLSLSPCQHLAGWQSSWHSAHCIKEGSRLGSKYPMTKQTEMVCLLFHCTNCTKTTCSMSLWPWRVCYRILEFTPAAQTDRQIGLLIAIIYIIWIGFI